jgi:microcystin degradation protein MlrC
MSSLAPKRVLLAGLFHETHTFLEEVTDRSQFATRRGAELLDTAGDGSPMGGAVEIARERGWQLLPAMDLRATPTGIVERAVLDEFTQSLDETIAAALCDGPIDGVLLILHGAMVCQGCLDVEGEVVRHVRARLGEQVPIAGVLDLHGNITPEFAAATQAFVAYRENPHADACEASRDGARLLDRLMRESLVARTLFAAPSIVWPPPGTGTAFEPMSLLEARARQFERDHPEFLCVNVFAGFAYADTPWTGVSFTLSTIGDEATAQAALDELCQLAWLHRTRGNVIGAPLGEVLDEIRRSSTGPIVVAEPSDNIGGGGPGDGTALLSAFITAGFERAILALNDPLAVQVLAAHAPGDRVTLDLGGRGSRLSAGPVRLEVELIRTGPGLFRLEDPHSHLASMCGDQFDMGPCAVVRHGGVTVLLTSSKTAPFDLGQWRSQGIIPEEQFVIAVKAAVAHRKVYDPIATRHLTVETPGPCASDLRSFPFRHLRRPIYPLDGAL